MYSKIQLIAMRGVLNGADIALDDIFADGTYEWEEPEMAEIARWLHVTQRKLTEMIKQEDRPDV